MKNGSTEKIKKLTYLAFLAAIIITLQIICTFVKFGPFSITLALSPIVIGAALYGAGAGAVLGFVLGAVVFFTGILGWDGGFVNYMMAHNAVATVLLCLLKSTAAGFVSGLLYKLIAKKSSLVGVVVAGISSAVVNTGLFALGTVVFFYDLLVESAAAPEALYTSPIALLFLAWIGVNFIVELLSNIALSTAIERIINVVKRKNA